MSKLSKPYPAALCKHLKPSSKTSLQPAIRLGRQAVALGLETLDLDNIHVRALTTLALKKAVKANPQGLKKEIAGTQRLVRQSITTINRFACEFGFHHES
ncbi:MAG: hypothetical protein WCV00_04655 [Verrucomicrobiia bacterium]